MNLLQWLEKNWTEAALILVTLLLVREAELRGRDRYELNKVLREYTNLWQGALDERDEIHQACDSFKEESDFKAWS